MTDERETALIWWTLLRHGGIAPGAAALPGGPCVAPHPGYAVPCCAVVHGHASEV